MKVILPFHASSLRRAARKAARALDWQKAASFYNRLVVSGRATPQDMVQLAHSLKEAGETAMAGKAYRDAAAAFPRHADAHLHYGLFLQHVERYAEAVDAFARVFALEPDNDLARAKLVQLDVVENDLDAAVLVATMAGHDAAPSRVGAITRPVRTWRLRRARSLARAKRWGEAARQYRRLLALDPYNASALVQLGHMALEQDDAAQAVTAYRTSLITRPRHPDTYVHLGHALKRLGRDDAAAQAYRTALRLQPNLAPALVELEAMGRNDTESALLDGRPDSSRPDDRERHVPRLSHHHMPSALSRQQQAIWLLLAAHVEHGN